MPDSTLINVDFPAPFSPHSAWISPGRRSNLTPLSATTPGNRFTTFHVARMDEGSLIQNRIEPQSTQRPQRTNRFAVFGFALCSLWSLWFKPRLPYGFGGRWSAGMAPYTASYGWKPSLMTVSIMFSFVVAMIFSAIVGTSIVPLFV